MKLFKGTRLGFGVHGDERYLPMRLSQIFANRRETSELMGFRDDDRCNRVISTSLSGIGPI